MKSTPNYRKDTEPLYLKSIAKKSLTNFQLKQLNRKEAQPDSILQANTPAQPAKISCKFIPALKV